MSESFNVLAWNVQERVGRSEYRSAVFDTLRKRMKDEIGAVVLTDVFREIPEPIDEVRNRLQYFADSEGYKLTIAEYEDEKHREGNPISLRQHDAVLSRMNSVATITRLATRNAIHLQIDYQGEDISLVGAHFDDRTEQTRIRQALAYTEQETSSLRILAGDLNSMHQDDSRARSLRSPLATLAFKRLPGRYKSFGDRLQEMARGDSMQIIEDGGLIDSDPSYAPTIRVANRFGVAQLDHILHSSGIRVNSFEVGESRPSDHNLVIANLSL